jgi:hypothetical protein
MAGQRKTTGERLETLRQKQERLKAQLDALASQKKAEDRRRETRRAFVVGAAALACAEADPAFKEALQKALQASVTRETDKAMIADLLGLQPVPRPPDQIPAPSAGSNPATGVAGRSGAGDGSSRSQLGAVDKQPAGATAKSLA